MRYKIIIFIPIMMAASISFASTRQTLPAAFSKSITIYQRILPKTPRKDVNFSENNNIAFTVSLGEWFTNKVDWIKAGWNIRWNGEYFAYSTIHNDDGNWFNGGITWEYMMISTFYSGWNPATKSCTGNVIYTATYLDGTIQWGQHLENITHTGIDEGAKDILSQVHCVGTTRYLK